jgi:hypothetical protein
MMEDTMAVIMEGTILVKVITTEDTTLVALD